MSLNLKNTLVSTLLEHLPTCLLPKPTSSCSPRSLSLSPSPSLLSFSLPITSILTCKLQRIRTCDFSSCCIRLCHASIIAKLLLKCTHKHTHTGCLRHRVARCRQGERVQSRLIIRNNFQLLNAQFNNFMCKRGNFLCPAQQIVYGSVTKLYPILYCMCVYECVRVSHTQA